jgi:NAD(P)-dependent dehydrogenase (short-subunit alcohol dehydrogenase family)
VTGANSGIGKETTRGLARDGYRVLMLCRNEVKAERAREEIVDDTSNEDVEIVLCDLSVQDEIEQAAYEVTRRVDGLDVLVNNAGLVLDERRITTDGHEYQFAVNHLGPFVLTHELLDPLRDAGDRDGPARIVNVASEAHRSAGSLPEGFQNTEGRYRGFNVYSQTKLSNILFTRELARRLDPERITANCLHPGVIASGFGRQGPWYVRWFMKLARPFLTDPEDGAQTCLYLATSPEVADSTGTYFEDEQPRQPSSTATDEELARELWQTSEQLTGADGWPKPRQDPD